MQVQDGRSEMRRSRFIACLMVIAMAVALGAACGGSGERGEPTQAPVETATPRASLDVEDLFKSVVMVAPGTRIGKDFEPVASGSGSIVDKSGLILTNYHVVDPDLVGAYDDIALYVAAAPEDVPDLTYFGGLAAWDEELDLAIIRITRNRNGIDVDPEALDLKTVRLGDSDDLEIGGSLTVLGYPAIGEGSLELTKGSVSGFLAAEGRKQAWIKTDARIAAGNSGGGTFDERGYLIGVPTAVYYVEQLGPEASGRIRPVNLALALIEEAKATTAVVIPSPGEAPVDLFEGDVPLLSASDIGPSLDLSEETYLTNADRAAWYDDPDSALDFYETHGRLGGVRRVFDNFEAVDMSGEAPLVVATQIDLYETERGAAGAASGCDEFSDTAWEFITAVGLEFYEPEYLSDPVVGDESCLFRAEEIVESPDEPPFILGFVGFRQSNVLAVVAMMSLPDVISFEALQYLAALQSNLLADELGIITPPRQSAAPPSPAPPAPASPIGYWTPEEAIGAYLASYGEQYAGDCSLADPNADIDMYCSMLYQDRGVEGVYAVGLTFSEADTWILVGMYEDGSFVVNDAAPMSYDASGDLSPPPW
jgi:S1-C subfamily serine protease